MERNCIQFQKGYGLAQFVDEYAAKEQCMWTLFRWRWPDGFRVDLLPVGLPDSRR